MCGGSNMSARAFNLLAVALLIQYVAQASSASAVEQNGGGGSLRQQPQLVDSIGVDFAAYVNDFNMQDEASIPEDILDQQHIQDADDTLDAVELQYGEYGETEAADIILESRRSTSRNFSIYDESESSGSSNNRDTSSGNNNKNSSGSSNKKKQQNNNNKKTHYNKFKNRKTSFEEDQGVDNDEKYSNEDELAMRVMSKTSGNGPVYKKLRNIHDKEHQKHQKQQQQSQNQQEFAETKGQQQKQQQQGQQHPEVKATETLNERKFNRATAGQRKTQDDSHRSSSNNNNNSNSNNHNRQEVQQQQNTAHKSGDIKLTETAIGDIEDNFRNEDEAAVAGTNNSNDAEDYEQHEDDESIAMSIDKDESAATAAANVVADKQSSAAVAAAAPTLIARKFKRHNGVRRPNYYDDSSNRAGKQRNFEEMYYRRQHYNKENSGDIDDDDENENIGAEMQQRELQENQGKTEPTKVQTDYSISYFGILTNGSNTSDDTASLVSGSSAGAALLRPGENADDAGADVAALENDDDDAETAAVHSIMHSHAKHVAATTTTTKTKAAQSAFEQHKAQRRNNRRNGHKSHKKKYKDYLRFAMTTEAAATARPVATATVADIAANAFNATKAKLTNVTKGNYQEQPGVEIVSATLTAKQRAEKLRQYTRKLQAEKSRGLPASPIFVIAGKTTNRNVLVDAAAATETAASTTQKPFYEGQINYYVETKDDEYDGKLQEEASIDARQQQHTSNIDRMIAADNGNWYRRVSPVLRNGIKSTSVAAYSDGGGGGASKLLEERLKRPQQLHQHHHQQFHQQQLHHHHTHHHRKPHHHKHQPTSQQQHHDKHFPRNPYQRKLLLPKKQHPSVVASITAPQTPLPPPSHKGAMQELGHQITEMEEFERYYAKWPHLARVQFQVYDEHYREEHPEIYTDYDDDYESAAELEEAQSGRDEDANLPPYIKKYNRRNKQLLNLLEGTLPPPTTRQQATLRWSGGSLLQTGPKDSSAMSASSGKSPSAAVVRIDDDYLKEKRRRYHNRGSSTNSHHFKDLFAQQRKVGNDLNSAYVSSTTEASSLQRNNQQQTPPNMLNQLPDEDVSISREELEEAEEDVANWQKEIETKSNKLHAGNAQMTWQIEKLTPTATATSVSTTTTTATSRPTPKAAIFKLPSYPAIAGSFIGKPRSRSAQFAPSSSGGGGGGGGSRANVLGFGFSGGSSGASNKYKSMPRFAADRPVASTAAPSLTTTVSSADGYDAGRTPPPTINSSFVYHRVVDASPRLVGAGATGRKQRLPFVAITDRRLETSKRTLLERQKDFEQNYFPMP